MTILKIEPNKKPYPKEVKNDLKSLQAEVGGYLESITLFDNLVLICNEEGKLRKLPPNRQLGNDIIAGDFFLVGTKSCDFISLTPAQIAELTILFL